MPNFIQNIPWLKTSRADTSNFWPFQVHGCLSRHHSLRANPFRKTCGRRTLRTNLARMSAVLQESRRLLPLLGLQVPHVRRGVRQRSSPSRRVQVLSGAQVPARHLQHPQRLGRAERAQQEVGEEPILVQSGLHHAVANAAQEGDGPKVICPGLSFFKTNYIMSNIIG